MRIFRCCALVGAVLAALCAATSARAAGVPNTGRLDFTVYRAGEDIGTHRLRFAEQDGRLEVDVETDIAVKLAFITLFRYEHRSHETWRDGELIALVAQTNDDGDHHELDVRANGTALDVLGDGKASKAPKTILPASLWNPRVLAQSSILNTHAGGELAVRVDDLGEETIQVGGKAVRARHYAMRGDFDRDLWYDDHDVLVRIDFKGKDGSDIQYVID